MIAIVGFYFVLPFVPLYIQELGVTGQSNVAMWAGLLTAGSALCMTVISPIWGVLADRLGRKPMVLRAMIAGAVILALMGIHTASLRHGNELSFQ
jgi:DHA1 family multidrug resistance protein-like MFS transporter